MLSNYKKLEATIPTYQALRTVHVVENNEPFVSLDIIKIPFAYMPFAEDMKRALRNRMVVRRGVYERLLRAQEYLTAKDPTATLFVTYGYRSLETQTERFNGLLEKMKNTTYKDEDALYNEVHRFIAVPTVAGHPTGGAVDITIKKSGGNFLDFGSEQYDFSTKNCYVFIDTISEAAKMNRMLLRTCMQKAGFAPFDGEWWHFSYGDRDWAYYYKKRQAIYSQVALDRIELS